MISVVGRTILSVLRLVDRHDSPSDGFSADTILHPTPYWHSTVLLSGREPRHDFVEMQSPIASGLHQPIFRNRRRAEKPAYAAGLFNATVSAGKPAAFRGLGSPEALLIHVARLCYKPTRSSVGVSSTG